jgi:hypothetical protein
MTKERAEAFIVLPSPMTVPDAEWTSRGPRANGDSPAPLVGPHA